MHVGSPWNIDVDEQKKMKISKCGLGMFCNSESSIEMSLKRSQQDELKPV